MNLKLRISSFSNCKISRKIVKFYIFPLQVITWATYHKDDPAPPEDDENKEKRTDDISSWDSDFLKVDQGTLFELILAANYLDIKVMFTPVKINCLGPANHCIIGLLM